MVCDSSWIWYVAADRSGSAPFSCLGEALSQDNTIEDSIQLTIISLGVMSVILKA